MERHRFDVISFVFGILFLALAASAAVGEIDLFAVEAKWVMPVALIIAGAAVLVATVPRRRREASESPDASFE
jgi:hypothetical protein